MNFLNQALLFGIFAVSIPIVIHLLNRRRFRKVPWAAMRFLVVSVEQNQRRMKLEDLILLLLRCAIVALLAFAVARPVVEGLQGIPGSKVAAAIVIDNSASMGTVEGGGTRLDLARASAKAVVERMPAGSSVAISTPFRPDEPTTEQALALRRVAEVSQTDRHADLLTALERAARALEGQAAAEKEIFLITDGHAEEWSAFAALEEKMREISAGTKLHLVLVGTPATSNLGITRLVPAGSLPAVDQPFRIDVDVTNHGVTPAFEVPVRLLVDGQPGGEPWVIDEVQPGRSESATLYATLPSAGYHRITVALESDLVPFDDQRTVVMQVVDHVRVLLVDGEPGSEPRESETFFLRHALAPVPEEARAAYPVKPVVISASQLAGENLADYHAVVLANVADLPLAIADRLTRYVDEGGGLIVFPGENVRTEFYNTMLHAKHRLLPAVLVSHQPADATASRFLEPTETNPLGLDSEMLASASFRQSYRLELPPAQSSAHRLVLRYDDGTPALVESEFGLGKVFLFTSTADTAWNNFAVRPAFVPFVNRLLGGIVQHRETNLNIEAGETLRHRLGAVLAGKEATVYEVADPEALGRLTTVEQRAGGSVLEFGATDRAGAYQATIEGHPTPVVFAARPSARESTLDFIGTEQVNRISESATVIRWNANSTGADFGESHQGSELWLPLLFLVIALVAVEMALAQWFSRSK
jgi:hypothetical protein